MKTALIIILLFSTPCFAESKGNKKVEKTSRVTDANFTGTTVHGQYAHSPEATVSVEQEKKLISVVKPRENFKLQIKQSLEDKK